MSSPAAQEDFYFLATIDGQPETHDATLQGIMAWVELVGNATGTIVLVGGADGDVPIFQYLNGQVTGLVE